MRKKTIRFPSAVAGALLLGAALSTWPDAASAQEVSTVNYVDLDRYEGKWYEIARLPNDFQSQCVSNVSAQYSKRADGRIDVINRCKKADGSMDEAAGVARIEDARTNAKLKVRFAPAWLSWLPFVWGDYWVLDLAADYSTAAVGDPSREYLWILSRTPNLPETAYQAIVMRVAAQGFEVGKLLKTRHEQ